VVVPMVLSPSLQADPTGEATLKTLIPLGRVGDPENDIGRPIAFLASEDSGFLTGATLPLDGGLTYFG
jgi:NAD(P)-dependent dehydrogenase (short-subunit alcohol dehydrogenase family)